MYICWAEAWDLGDNSSEDFWERFPIGRGHFGVSYRQETMCEWFPIVVKRFGLPYRQETMREGFPIEVMHIGLPYRQETIRPEISRLRFAPLEMTGRRDTIVLHTDRKLCAKGFLLK